jgi:hypothetical protein
MVSSWGWAYIGDTSLARARPYIYCGYSRQLGFAYIGMTLDRRGVLGRWADHLSRDPVESSFRRRLHEWDSSAWQRLNDLVIFWADMGDASQFITVDTSHREAVEYLVQNQIRVIVAGGAQPLHVISRVRSNQTVNLPIVRSSARMILDAFQLHYKSQA